MDTKTKQGPSVRVSENCKAVIAQLADSLGVSQTEVVHRAVDLLQREQFFDQMKQDYLAIAESKATYKVLQSENKLFDSATSDGIE